MPNASRVAALIGWCGVAAFLGTALIAGIAYTGSAGEPFSPLNHYVSELGERKNSELNLVFNAGLVIGGLCLIAILLEVGRRVGGWHGRVVGGLGVLSGVAGSLVGIFPMDQRSIHVIVSGTYFLTLAATVALATLWMGGPAFPRTRAARWLGALTIVSSVGFFVIFQLQNTGQTSGDYATVARPAVALDTTVEWLALVGIMAWVVVAGWIIWKAESVPELMPLSGVSR